MAAVDDASGARSEKGLRTSRRAAERAADAADAALARATRKHPQRLALARTESERELTPHDGAATAERRALH